MSKERVGRNDLCPCGSGKKYKQCCGKAGPLKRLASRVGVRREEESSTLRVIKDPEPYEASTPAPSSLSLRKFSAKVISTKLQAPSVEEGVFPEYSCFSRFSEEERALMSRWETRDEDYRVTHEEAARLADEKFILSPPKTAPISLGERPTLPPEILPHYTADFRGT